MVSKLGFFLHFQWNGFIINLQKSIIVLFMGWGHKFIYQFRVSQYRKVWEGKGMKYNETTYITGALRSDFLYYDSKGYPVCFLKIYWRKLVLQLRKSNQLPTCHFPLHFNWRHKGFSKMAQMTYKKQTVRMTMSYTERVNPVTITHSMLTLTSARKTFL